MAQAARRPRGTQMSFRLARRRQSRLRNRTDNPDESAPANAGRSAGVLGRSAPGRRPCRVLAGAAERLSPRRRCFLPTIRAAAAEELIAGLRRGTAAAPQRERIHRRRSAQGLDGRPWLRPKEVRGPWSRSHAPAGGVRSAESAALPLSPCSAGHRRPGRAAPCAKPLGGDPRRRSLSRRRCRRQRTRRARVHRRGGSRAALPRGRRPGRQNCSAGASVGRTRQRRRHGRQVRRLQLGLRRACLRRARQQAQSRMREGFGSIPNGWRRSLHGGTAAVAAAASSATVAATSGGRRGPRSPRRYLTQLLDLVREHRQDREAPARRQVALERRVTASIVVVAFQHRVKPAERARGANAAVIGRSSLARIARRAMASCDQRCAVLRPRGSQNRRRAGQRSRCGGMSRRQPAPGGRD